MPKIIVDADEICDVEEASRQLDRGVATIWRWIRNRKIFAIKIHGRTYIPISEIERVKESLKETI